MILDICRIVPQKYWADKLKHVEISDPYVAVVLKRIELASKRWWRIIDREGYFVRNKKGWSFII